MIRASTSPAQSAATATRVPVQAVALVAICLGYFMTILDATIVNVALPSIGQHLDTDVSGLQWILDSYQLVFAAFLLTGGLLGDRFGSRAVFVAGLTLFTVASALCGLATSLGMLIASRMLQGVGAALAVPASLALIRHTFADERERARAFGIWGAIAGIAAVTGPILGGVLTGLLGWPSIFLVNVPVGLVAIMLTMRTVVPAPAVTGRALDPAGQVTGILGLGLLTFAIIEGASQGWMSPLILGALAICLLATIAFLVVERRHSDAMLPFDLFGDRTFSAGTLVGFLMNFGFYGQLFWMSLYFQQIRAYSPALTGFALLPESGVVAISSFLSGRIASQTGARLPMVVGLATGGIGLLALATIGATTPYPVLAIMLAAAGFGISFAMPAMTVAVTNAAPRERVGIASGVLNASRQVGGTIGVALLGALVGRPTLSMSGLHLASVIAGLAFLVGLVLTLRGIQSAPTAEATMK
jgi:DHA2 family methylenomycin A resistance protein-like MFS transporter